FRGGGGAPAKAKVTLHLTGDGRPLASVTDDEPLFPSQAAAGELAQDKRLHFIPAGKLVVFVPASNDKLVLRRFDLDEALDKAGIDFLLVTSQPPTQAKPGTAVDYQLAVKSKKGGVKYKLESGPPGMKLSAEGRLRWEVPANFADAEANVI